MVKRYLSIWLMAFLCLSLSAKVESDSIILYFRMNESRIDSSFADNRA